MSIQLLEPLQRLGLSDGGCQVLDGYCLRSMGIRYINAKASAKMTNASRNDLTDEVLLWLKDHLGLRASAVLTPETRINMDLGVDGDDGAELLRAFAERFAVGIDKFSGARYFGPEASGSPMSLLRRILGIRGSQALDPLFISKLVELATRARD